MTDMRSRIEEKFESLAYTIYRNKYKTLLIMMLVIAGILSQLPKLRVDISNEGFMHEDDPSLIDYNAFREQFGRDELILVAVESPNVFDINCLNKLKAMHDELEEKVPYIDEINSLINARDTKAEADRLIVEDLFERWPQNKEEIAVIKNRVQENPLYKNIFISEDNRMTTIVIKTQTYSSSDSEMDVMDGFDEGFETEDPASKASKEKKFLTTAENSEAVNAVHKITTRYNAPDFKIYITGSAAITHFQKKYMKGDMQKFVKFALIIIIAFLFIMFRRISGVLLPLIIIILSFLSTFSIMAAFNAPIKLPTQILPSLLLAVSVGYSVHLLAIFYHHLQRNGDKAEAIAFALSHSGLAIIMTAVTTAGGLFSISTSDVAPIADLGLFGGIGILLAMVYTIILIPALLAIIPVKIPKSLEIKTGSTAMDRLLNRIAALSTRHPLPILVISFMIIAAAIFYIPRINFSHDVLRWFPEGNPIRTATEKVNEKMFSL